MQSIHILMRTQSLQPKTKSLVPPLATVQAKANYRLCLLSLLRDVQTSDSLPQGRLNGIDGNLMNSVEVLIVREMLSLREAKGMCEEVSLSLLQTIISDQAGTTDWMKCRSIFKKSLLEV